MKKQNRASVTNQKKRKRRGTNQKYSYELKRRVVNDILKGILTKEEALIKYGIKSRQSINYWIKKYSLLNYRNGKNYGMKESLEEELKRLRLENEELREEKIILNIVIDIADEEFKTNIRKKHLPQQLQKFKKHRKYIKK